MFDEGIFKMFSDESEEQSTEKTENETSEEFSSFDFNAKTIVLSVGGSLAFGEKPNTPFIAKLAERISQLHDNGYKFAVVCGGGKACRNYIASAKSLGTNNFNADKIAINVTRLNALLFIQSLEKAFPEVLVEIEKAKSVIETGKIPVFGGLLPGITTDCVAALLAEFLNAEFINLTNVDGVYSSDPKQNPNAKFYPEISYERLQSLLSLAASKPGQNLVLDLPSCLVLKRSKIPALILNGNDLENFASAVRGEEFSGTRVVDKVEK